MAGMLSGAYYGVISPEGAASILGRYKDDADKAKRFPVDCHVSYSWAAPLADPPSSTRWRDHFR
jgi:outer membrane scaffolding protein for murein synthesis (MipA/OmpV family)